ncbi:MAG TPA: putative O-glycosylation ligase, exosortase A system-associated [Candidatus Binatia bacterium]|nr:putative O-glycosylation ligase, exosortase A system-associated [Candidatus Binatia bacterium]
MPRIVVRPVKICETENPLWTAGGKRVGFRDVILIIVEAIAVPLSFINPFTGVLFWTWVGYFNPQEFTWGAASSVPIAFLVAIATLSGLVITKDRRFPPLTTETVLLALLWLWFGITTANTFLSPAFSHHSADSAMFLWAVSKTLLMVFVSLMLVTDARRLRLWYLVTAGSFAVFALKSAVFGVLTTGLDKVYGPKNSMIYDNNDFGLAMNMALPMFVAMARTEPSRAVRWCFWAALPMGMAAVVLTYSRGALLGLAVVLSILAWRSRRRWLAACATAFAVAGVFVAAPEKWVERMHTMLESPTKDQSAMARFHSWTFAFKLFRDHPITGGGFQTFTAPLYAQYNMLRDQVQGPHSIYFQILAEHGLPGILIFFALIGACLFSCRRLRRVFAEQQDFRLAAYAEMIQLSLVTFLISGAFLGRAYFDLFYQLVATVILLKVLAREPVWEPEETSPEPAEETAVLA